MHILMLSHHMIGNHAVRRGYYWGRYLVRRGHQVTLVAISQSQRWKFEIHEHEGVRIVKTPDLLWGEMRSGWDAWDTTRRIGYLAQQSFDLVHSIDSRPVSILPALVLRRLKGTKLVLDWGDWWGRGGTSSERRGNLFYRLIEPVETLFEESFRKYADGSVVLSSALARRAIALGVSADSIVKITTGADVERFKPLDKCEARRKIGVDSGIPIVGYIGALFAKDEEFLWRAFEIVTKSTPGTKLFLIGKTKLTVPDNLRDDVVTTGWISYEMLQQSVASCDVMLLPLRNSIANAGRWPGKIGDYLTAGKPVLATRVGDVAMLIEEGQCGVLTDDRPEDFASTILDVLHHPGWIEEMGKNARKVAETKLDWRLLTDQLEQFYFRILSI